MLVGVYEENLLINSYKSDEKTSESLPKVFDDILHQYTIKNLFFVKGPGSFMAIKVTYIFLRTIAETLNIPIFACDGFLVNENAPIHAHAKLYFVKNEDKIETQLFQKEPVGSFCLPKHLNHADFSKDIEPLYILPAI